MTRTYKAVIYYNGQSERIYITKYVNAGNLLEAAEMVNDKFPTSSEPVGYRTLSVEELGEGL
jgi:hypothetical protein